MISITVQMIFKTICFSALFGAASGITYALVGALFRTLRNVLKRQKNDLTSIGASRFFNGFDFFFFLITGAVIILINYSFCDGVSIFYSAVSFVLLFWLSVSAFGKITGETAHFFTSRQKKS
jgi:hypothetical protein